MKKIQTHSSSKGFSLIELLIVMAIIAVLATISIFALQGARRSARDARKKSDIEAIRTALELYKSDCGVYPAPPLPSGSLTGSGATGCPATNIYIQDVPEVPNTTTQYAYRRATPTTYQVCVYLEDGPTSADADCASVNCSATGGICNYGVRNP